MAPNFNGTIQSKKKIKMHTFFNQEAFNLPSYHDMTDADQELVCEAISDYIDRSCLK